MRILIDMNLSPQWVIPLRDAGLEAEHWSSVGAPGATDATILEWAKSNGFVVFTHDLDFGALLASSHGSAPSVVQVRTQDVMPDRLAPLVVRVIRQHQGAIDSGALITLDESKMRVRILPIE
ncbi:MAG: hypothetical protein RLZZ303_1921 [Candidatus Hydrogenedentota bacterium]|jgi:predicted nuclease of predicted toxin-antitoxin system